MTTRKYYAHGIQGVEIEGRSVPMDELVEAWERRCDNDLLRAGLDATNEARRSQDKTIVKLKAHLATRSRERDEAVNEAGQYRKTIERLTDERDVMTRQLLRERSLRESIEELERRSSGGEGKRFWLVSRRDTVQRGEYGDVVVFADDADDAVYEVLNGGYGGTQPLYGYSNADNATVVELRAVFTDEHESGIVVADTLR